MFGKLVKTNDIGDDIISAGLVLFAVCAAFDVKTETATEDEIV